MRVEGKVAVVTGGAGGIGAETARVLVREGAKVVIADVVEPAGQALAREIGAKFHKHDVTDEKQWQALVGGVIATHGQIDVLVNAAGIEGDLSKGGFDVPLAEWRRVLAINLDGTFLGCRTCLPKMLARGTGSIVNIASIVSGFATPTALAYGASKAAVAQLTRSFAMHGAANDKRVRCNSVHPGVIKTRMTDNIITEFGKMQNLSPEQSETAIMSVVPFKVRGTPADVANLILFLASDESAYVTGSEFQVDGGWHVINAG
jgi:3(or 17)beta-hydroxysteroid dehydrogenase